MAEGKVKRMQVHNLPSSFGGSVVQADEFGGAFKIRPTVPRYLYLAGPIAGLVWAEATDWRTWVQSHLAPGIEGISPMRLREWYKEHDGSMDYTWLGEDSPEYLITAEQHAIAQRDFMDVQRADMVLANMPAELNHRRPSWGTAVEMGLAWAQQKPLVVVTDDEDLKAHPLVRGAAGWIVPSLKMGVDVVNSALGAYT